ncbi:54S ribosomal protein MRP49 mitochondrial [Spathaspora sp. JA1]|nr:54S ribosomal protein MRP49 mitochondrial [Spathaspora sp. JA1]
MFKAAVESAVQATEIISKPSKYKLQAAKLNKIAGVDSQASVVLNPTKYKGLELQMISNRQNAQARGIYEFWRQDLRTLKFHNQNLDFQVTKITYQEDSEIEKIPARLIVRDLQGGEFTIDCKNKTRSDILSELLKLTKAEPVPVEEIPVVEGTVKKVQK